VPDVCDRCGYAVIEVNGQWVHAEQGDAAMCTLLKMADRARAAQQAVNELGAGKPASNG
jgi:hypothetical protein